MAHELTEIEIEEVSMVDAGANQAADVLLVKRSPWSRMRDWVVGKMAPQSTAEVLAESEMDRQLWDLLMALQASLESIQYAEDLSQDERLALMQQSAAEFAEAVEGMDRPVAKKFTDAARDLSTLDQIPAMVADIHQALGTEPAASEETPMTEKKETPTAEDQATIAKADLEALMAKAARAEELEAAAQEAQAIAKRATIAKSVEDKAANVPGISAEDLTDLMVKVDATAGGEIASKIMDILAAASAAIGEGGLTDEVGEDQGQDATDPMEMAKAKAQALQAEDPSLTFHKAFTKAIESDPGLAEAYLKGRR